LLSFRFSVFCHSKFIYNTDGITFTGKIIQEQLLICFAAVAAVAVVVVLVVGVAGIVAVVGVEVGDLWWF